MRGQSRHSRGWDGVWVLRTTELLVLVLVVVVLYLVSAPTQVLELPVSTMRLSEEG